MNNRKRTGSGTVSVTSNNDANSGTTGRRRIRDKALRQRALLEAATSVFAERGYDAATTREIAARAGCSDALIQHHFGGKRGLLLAVMDAGTQGLNERLHATDIKSDLVEDLQQFLLQELDSMWEHRERIRVTIGQSVIDPEFGATAGHSVHERFLEALKTRLAEHQRRGRIRPDYDPSALANVLGAVTVYLAFMSQIVWSLDREQIRRLALVCAEIITRGMAQDEPGGPLDKAQDRRAESHSMSSTPSRAIVRR